MREALSATMPHWPQTILKEAFHLQDLPSLQNVLLHSSHSGLDTTK
jgi:hypothetical protein